MFRNWQGLKRRLLERFQQSYEGTLYEQFLAIYQEGSAREYVTLFEKLAGQLHGVPEPVLEGTFIKGLKPDLRAAIRVMQPEGLTHAMKLSIFIDGNKSNEVVSRGSGSNRSFASNNNSYFSNHNSGTGSTRTLITTGSSDRKTGSFSTTKPG